MSRTIKAEELQSKLKTDDVKVIDVRRSEDYKADDSAIPNASWFDPANIDGWCDTMPKDKDVVLYCMRGGSVSNEVVDTLQSKGIKARYIEGGFDAWKKSGGGVDKK